MQPVGCAMIGLTSSSASSSPTAAAIAEMRLIVRGQLLRYRTPARRVTGANSLCHAQLRRARGWTSAALRRGQQELAVVEHLHEHATRLPP